MFTAVKGHVLKEVGKTTLALFLLDGAHALCDVEIHTVLGIVVVADVVGQSAVQLADAYVRVSRDGTHLLSLGHIHAECHDHHEQYGKDFFHLHLVEKLVI